MHYKPTITQEEKLTRMTESPLPGLIFSLAVPTIVSMLISALYNMADTYFVGLIGNASATGAIGVVFPLMSLMQAIAFMFGHAIICPVRWGRAMWPTRKSTPPRAFSARWAQGCC